MSRTHSEAEAEIRAAWLWYNTQSASVAERFQTALRAALAAVEEGPNRWPPGPQGTRRYLVKKFPYAVIYRNDERGLIVFAVAHTSREPGYWTQRLKDEF